MEVVIRSVHFLLTGKKSKTEAPFKKIRDIKGWKEAILKLKVLL